MLLPRLERTCEMMTYHLKSYLVFLSKVLSVPGLSLLDCAYGMRVVNANGLEITDLSQDSGQQCTHYSISATQILQG